jgi:rfaE bifunctional protein kinase chain/domain
MKRVLVVGDSIIDVHHYGVPLKTSEEVKGGKAERTEVTWGGAALLVRNLLELGVRVSFVSRIGGDEGAALAKKLVHPRLTKHFIIEKGKVTTVKERFFLGGKKVFKWNHLNDENMGKVASREFQRKVRQFLSDAECLLVSDYRHGMLGKDLAKFLVATAHKLRKPLYVDSQVAQAQSNHQWYEGADLAAVNEKEAVSVYPKFGKTPLEFSLQALSKILKCPNIIVKLGAKGSVAWLSGKLVRTPAYNVKAVDTTGAGDAFLAALATGAFPPTEKNLVFANKWAGLATEIKGTIPPKLRK